MMQFELDQLRENPGWQSVLRAYAEAMAVGDADDPERSGWANRLSEVPGVDPSELARAHGRLIAFGMLKVQLAGRATGLQYQLTHLGRQFLANAISEDAA